MTNQLPKLCEDFLNYMSILNKSDNTISGYRIDLLMWARYKNFDVNVSAKELEQIPSGDFYSFISSITKRNGNKPSSTTIIRIMATLNSFYNYLVKRVKLISLNPIQDLEKPKQSKKLPKFLIENEMIELLHAVDKVESRYPERDYAILTLFLNTGIRKSELININIEDIKNNSLVVRGKGDKEREVPLTPSCTKAINSYIRAKYHTDGNALFVGENNKRLGINGVTHLVKKYLNVIGKGNLSTHKLRHSCFTNLIQNGTDIRTIQELAGHSDINTTSIYLHVTNKAKQKAVMNTALADII